MVTKFIEHLKVSKEIVSILSKQTYVKNFAYSIRELVSNAYDADALTVKIKFDKSFSIIEIEDDGNGMTHEEFKKFLIIAGTKSDSLLTRRYRRKRIGQFGVGFLAIFPFSDAIEIITTAENSDEVLTANITSKKYFDSKKNEDVSEIPVNVSIAKIPNEKQNHYTKIKLVNPTYLVKQQFVNVETRKRDSIATWDSLKRFKWELQEDLPITYSPDSKFYDIFRYEEPISINVFLNNEQLYRNDLCSIVLEDGSINVEGIICKYIFTTDYKAIKPSEARGIKIRVNNVGIGQRSYLFVNRNRSFSRLHWINGEISLSEKIKDQLNISRESFISTPVIDKIYETLADKLTTHAYFVEQVSESEKELEATINNSKSKQVKPKREIIDNTLKKLESKGFTVQRESRSTDKSKKSFSIDKSKKIVTVKEDEINLKDYINAFGKKQEIEYSSWDYSKSDYPACRFKNNSDIVEVNQNFPLFKSKSTGSVFKKITILLLLSSINNRTSKDMFQEITSNLVKEFKDFI